MKNLVVFASGSGSNFQAIIDSIKEGTLDAGIAGLITDRPGIGAIERANSESIPVYTIKYDTQSSYTEQLIHKLDEWKPDLIILAGYLKKIPVAITEKYPNQIINIHPSLLPKYGGKGFYGLNVHKAVVDASEKESGCTVHFVNEFYDQGDIIEQKKVPVSPDDTPESLARKVLKEEHKLLPKVIAEILNSN
ncbi:phosphoribosylglycinamide formyltransferase [Rhodohalobacter barkolensis]|uniref:Phosphoribosylglycinamide formyltransferase n=1 Tax=Rhodohalobacter barkolensis TaxID=2053187 RepID=A0A2N0VIE8_9BACT|nr:phosphoribosylglycinamide formyltransferase [Rhodohalobacter barkolensis]PKD43959.1 phosphoribosylglycinamide formyltransferase [Rhodohalobacter barkolensis]